MSLISRSIANLFNGVSQQPSQLRHSSQCELQENGYSSIATGLRKRPPAEHVARLMDSPVGETPDEPAVHIIHRDKYEKYVVSIVDSTIRVWDLEGNEKVVNKPNGTAYLDATSSRDYFSFVTAADHTFILNKEVTTSAAGNVVPTNLLPFCSATFTYLAPAAGNGSNYYEMTVNGKQCGFTLVLQKYYNYPGFETTWPHALTLSAGLELIASQMRNKLPGWKVSVLGGVTVACYAPSTSTPAPTVSAQVRRSNGDIWPTHSSTLVGTTTGVGAITGTKQRFTDLPASPASGEVWLIVGDPSNGFDDYWVKWSGSAWVETTQPGMATTISSATMPHVLVREADGTFTFKRASWDSRAVGDESSNPSPSFIGKRIQDIFFYRNRLGFLSGEYVTLSRAGEYYNFWKETVTADFDTDPIDTPASGNKVSDLRYAVPFNKDLMLFSDQTQFRMTGGEALKPGSVRIDVSTEFDSSPLCRPVGVGQELFFAVDRSGWTGIHEYYVEEDTISDDAADITAHAPSYLPGNVFKLSTSTSEDTLCALSLDKRNSFWVYKYYWSGNEKVQSSWSEFVFDEDDAILTLEFLGTVAYLVVRRADGVFLEKMDLQPNRVDANMRFLVHLDRRCSLLGVYDAVNDWTTWTLPYDEPGDMQVVLSADFAGQKGSLIGITRPSSTEARAPGKYDTGLAFVGKKYTFRYRFSELYVKDEKDVAVSGGVLKLRRMAINYDSTAYFRAEVTPKARQTYSYPFTGKILGSVNFVIGLVPIESGTFTFPVQTSNLGVTIDLVNDSPYPSTFQSAEWVGEFTMKASR